MGVLDIFKTRKKKGEKLVAYLKNNITEQMSLSDIVDVFEKMCQSPIKEDMVLFQAGTYKFTGEELFYFSLVRQFPNEQEEYYQIHVDVLYAPSSNNANLIESTWDIDIDGNIYDYIRKSNVYNDVKDDEYVRIDIYMDET